MNERYSWEHVDAILRRVGTPADVRETIMRQLKFPVEQAALRTFLISFGITHDSLINSLGGSP